MAEYMRELKVPILVARWAVSGKSLCERHNSGVCLWKCLRGSAFRNVLCKDVDGIDFYCAWLAALSIWLLLKSSGECSRCLKFQRAAVRLCKHGARRLASILSGHSLSFLVLHGA